MAQNLIRILSAGFFSHFSFFSCIKITWRLELREDAMVTLLLSKLKILSQLHIMLSVLLSPCS